MELVSISEFNKRYESFLELHLQFCDELAKINRGEHDRIEAMPGESMHEKITAYEKEHLDIMMQNQKSREMLMEKYKEYAFMEDFKYFTVARTVEDLDELLAKSTPSYEGIKKDLLEFTGQHVYGEGVKGMIEGTCIGMSFFVSDVLFYVEDELHNFHHLESVEKKKTTK